MSDADPNKFQAHHARERFELDPGLRELEEKIVEQLRSVYDPEIPVNIYELGLIYDIDIKEGGIVNISMTLTSPACPVAGTLPPDVEARVKAIPGVIEATVEITWDPPWGPDKMTEAARLQLNMM
jgi:FeS assembly SUF system protein